MHKKKAWFHQLGLVFECNACGVSTCVQIEEMTERDWRIFREDFNISYKVSLLYSYCFDIMCLLHDNVYIECFCILCYGTSLWTYLHMASAGFTYTSTHAQLGGRCLESRASEGCPEGWLQEAITDPDGCHSHWAAAAWCDWHCWNWYC